MFTRVDQCTTYCLPSTTKQTKFNIPNFKYHENYDAKNCKLTIKNG